MAGIQAQDVKPGSVCWEVSEAVVAACEPELLHNIGRLSLRGYGIGAVHCGRYEAKTRDFACFPLSEISIDPMFVHEAAQRSHRRPLLDGLLAMAGKLGVPACADGIENVDDWALMREMGCSTGQGPLVAVPMEGASSSNGTRTAASACVTARDIASVTWRLQRQGQGKAGSATFFAAHSNPAAQDIGHDTMHDMQAEA